MNKGENFSSFLRCYGVETKKNETPRTEGKWEAGKEGATRLWDMYVQAIEYTT